MVLPIFLSSLLGNGLVSKGIQGLAQGGGFGLGYGFMVRAGYDLYGALKEKMVGQLQGMRYAPDTALSMAGTGGLMGLKRQDSQPDPVQAQGLNRLVGKSNVNEYLRRFGKSPIPTAEASKGQISTNNNPYNIRTGERMSDWYYNNVYLVNKRNDRIRARGRHGHRQVYYGMSRIA